MSSVIKIWLSGFLVINSLGGCTNTVAESKVSSIGYDLSKPDKTIILPYVLREVSGITVIDSSTVACIQDEKGVVFLLDLRREQVTKQIYFNPDGDFEGICRVDQTLYVLKSNGVLFKIANFETSSFADKIDLSSIREEDNEGLCFDKVNNRLLIAPKSKSGKDPGSRKTQKIYAYDLASGQQDAKVAYEIKAEETAGFTADNDPLKGKKGKKKKKSTQPEITLSPSEIAIHPITGKLFLLSAEDHMLYIIDPDSKVEYTETLDPMILNRPEGLTFFDNGDMLISNEAGNKYPTILRFKYRNRLK
jgi:uncharacterized protein YjiK